jgi:hypothetical protein
MAIAAAKLAWLLLTQACCAFTDARNAAEGCAADYGLFEYKKLSTNP